MVASSKQVMRRSRSEVGPRRTSTVSIASSDHGTGAKETKLAQWFLDQKRAPSAPPAGYELRRGQLDPGPMLIHRATRMYIWPHLLQLGQSLKGQYDVLYYYTSKPHFREILQAGSFRALWRSLEASCAERGLGHVLLCSAEPASWPTRRLFWSGRLLLAKAKVLHYAKHDAARYEFCGDTAADYCVAVRVPQEWIRDGENSFVWVQMEQLERASAPLGDQLFAAVKADDEAMVHQLMEMNANPNATNRTYWRPLMVAACFGYVGCAQELLKHGAELAVANAFGGKPLSLAVVHGNAPMVELLLAHRADVNESDQWAETPLHLAAKSGHAEVTETLLRFRARVHARSIYGDLPYDVCKIRGFSDLAQRLREVEEKPPAVEVPYPLPKDVERLGLL